MRLRSTFWILLGLLLLAGAWLFWPSGQRNAMQKQTIARPDFAATRPASTAPPLFAAGKNATNTTAASARTNRFAWRLSNTTKTIGQLTGDPHAILLENALIDSSASLNLAIPKNLQAQGDPGAYIVQARGPVDNAFRSRLAAAGAQIVSYIPNNAYLVTISAGGAAGLAGQPGVQSVIPYEPYYKLPESLMPWVGKTFPADRQLRVAAYPGTADQLRTELVKSGAQILAEDTSPFGRTFIIENVTDVAALVRQGIVQRAEPAFRRMAANDLSRVTMGISSDTITSSNYMDLSGKNVLVEVNDSGIDSTHPDFTLAGTADAGPSGPARVTGAFASSLFDTNGHGTFVAGIIAGNGSRSKIPFPVGSVAQGSVTNADFRGKAPLASLYSVGFLDVNGNAFDIADSFLQAAPALTNALISNNSWNYVGDNTYNLAAASYDAAVRDALPLVTGSQPVQFVFPAGNDGGGNDDGGGGDSDTILSPGTSKNVITVGALEQLRNITNTYTPLDSTNQVAVWAGGTDSGTQVAGYSGRGNVGIGVEGTYGRFKPDVVAPGSFLVSTRSQQWDEVAYYNPTNYYFQEQADLIAARSVRNENLSLNFSPPNITFNSNIVSVQVFIFPNLASPSPFPDLPIFVSHLNYPDPAVPGSYDFIVTNTVSIPPDGGGSYLSLIQNGNLFMTIVNTNSYAVPYDFVTEIVTTNQAGNYFQVLSNLNNTLGPSGGPWYYRYESGTSIAAPAVSGVLALMQDYFTNTLHALPTPALLKAMLINGARPVGSYSYNITNDVNFEGWGLPNLPTTLPPGVTNQVSAPCTSFFLDQDSTNALATGDSRTFTVTIDEDQFAQVLPLQVTLAWTDPPGNPAASLKLVNNLDLVVTNLDTGEVYFGNDISPGTTFNLPWNTNSTPAQDSVNNVENVIVPPLLGGSYSVTVIGTSVNVNAVTAQTNNTVQDFALVISSGNGEITNGLMVTAGPLVSHPTTDQQVTPVYVDANGMATNSTQGGVFLNQLAGANTPLLGTNTVGAGGSSYASNAIVTLGMTNQWHFYIVQNNTSFSNAAFITFLPNTLSTPRMGVFANSDANATQPDADIDLYVSTDPSLTNLNPVVISNCVHGTQIGASLAGVFNGASLGGGGTEFIVDTNSRGAQTYYVGVKSETADAVEYGFLPVFSEQPFSEMDGNGNEIVHGLLLPVSIPDGTPKHPGHAYIFALAILPIEVQNVIVTDQIFHQNFGDLVGTLNHSGPGVVLNNHDSLPPGFNNFVYDDGPVPVAGSQPPDGPGSLQNFQGQQGLGPWIFTQLDDSLTQTGAVTAFNLLITPHQDLNNPGINISVQGGGYFYGFIDVPAGVTNLTIAATNTTLPTPDSSGPITVGQLFEKFGSQLLPTQTPPTNFDQMVTLSNYPPASTTFPGGVISIGPSDVPPIQPGRYYVTLYNPSTTPQTFHVVANFQLGQIAPVNFASSGPTNLLDDAVTYSSVFVTNTQPIATVSVGLRVDHPRISDLVFHLISPDGTRFLLMENRGGTTTNGAGLTILTTNIVNVASAGGAGANTNYVKVGSNTGTLTINYDFYELADQMTVYASTNPADFSIGNAIYNTTLIPGSGQLSVPFTTTSGYLTIIMNQFGNPAPTTLWTYTAGGVQTNFYYLTLTQDTNLTTTPIKFAPPPFVPTAVTNFVVHADTFLATNFITVTNFLGGFEGLLASNYTAPSVVDGWSVDGGQVSVVTDQPNAYAGSNFLALANGSITRTLATVAGVTNTLTFAYRGPGIVGWWRGESNALDSVNSINGTWTAAPVYAAGEVGSAFVFSGVDGSGLNLGNPPGLQLQNFTIESWIKRSSSTVVSFGSGGNANLFDAGFDGYLLGMAANGGLFFDKLGDVTPLNGPAILDTSFHHVALTKRGTTVTFYLDGIASPPQNYTGTFVFHNLMGIGNHADSVNPGQSFLGTMDEVSFYQRALSDSEVNAIYANGSAGKFNPFQFTNSPAQSLAQAGITLPGLATNSIFGSNTVWQIRTINFVPTLTNTTVTISGLEPGMLLDSFTTMYVTNQIYTVTNFVTNAVVAVSNLYYLPEQSLDPLIGTSAYGLWQLEIQDDRVGATNHTILDSWQLSFIFANTNPVPAFTNSIPPGSLVWYQVDVPTNADFATNILTAATGPLNMWFSTNAPPTTNTLGGDVQFLSGVTSGSVTLGTNGSPANVNPPAYMIPGGTYYIGIENPGGVTVQYGFHVDFHLNINNPFAFTQPATLVTGNSARLNGMASPNGAPATAWFEWGTSTLYGNSTPPVAVGGVANVVYTNSVISGLAANVPYHFRLVVSNAQTVVHGFDQVLDEAYVVAWGANYVGQANVPSGLSNAVAIAGAFDHSLALKNDGTAVAWGDNTFGQATVPAGLNNLLAVAGGAYYSLVLKNNGTVASWGANILNQTNVPAGLNNVVTIAGGTYSSLALKNDGNVVAWGANFFSLTNVPATLSNAVAIAGGSYHSLAIKNDGTVLAWGDNSAGQTNVPVGLTNVVAIAGGSYHSLALRYNGTVVSWGDNSAGQANVPVGLSNVVAVAAGGFNSLALKTDGTVVSWGDNTVGQNSVPAGLTNVVALASGYLHSLALTPQSIASLTNVVLNLTNGVSQTNTISPGGITYYRVSVPANADFATNSLSTLNAGQTLNLWFSTSAPNLTSLLLGGVTNGTSILSTSSAPTNFVPGSFYYLGVQNTNSFAVAYGIGVDFHLVTSTNPPLLTNILSIVHTSIGGTNGFLLTWFAPSNALFKVEWTTGIAPSTWSPFTNIIGYNTNVFTSPTSTQFNFFDDGSQTGGFGPTRFYRLKLLVPPATTVPISSIIFTNGNFQLTWSAPTNSQFNVRSATNLVPPITWTIFAGGPIISTNGTFTFTDTNAPLFMKFYQLLLLP